MLGKNQEQMLKLILGHREESVRELPSGETDNRSAPVALLREK
jgi:hypothetical protein